MSYPRLLLCLLPFLLNACLVAQKSTFEQQTQPALMELKELVSIPNNGLAKADIQKNIDWLSTAFENRGFQTQSLPNKGNPLLFAEKIVDKNLPTVLFYMHIDGQPVDPRKWAQDNPYEAVLKAKNEAGNWEIIPWSSAEKAVDPNWRIFGRSAADDKGPIVGFLNSMDLLKQEGKSPAFNVKIILDSEEEIGSKYLAEAVAAYESLLKADVLIINDGPVHISGEPTLIFGCRGITTVNITCLLYTSPSPRDATLSRMPSSA